MSPRQTVNQTAPVQSSGKSLPKAKAGEKVTWVRFHPKSSKDQPDDVELSVNGEVLVIKRNVPVPLPERFVECARNAHYPQYSQVPGEDRKIVGQIMHFPFDTLKEGTREEFNRYRTQGTSETRRALSRDERAAEEEMQSANFNQALPGAPGGVPGLPGLNSELLDDDEEHPEGNE